MEDDRHLLFITKIIPFNRLERKELAIVLVARFILTGWLTHYRGEKTFNLYFSGLDWV